MDLRQTLTRSCADEGITPHAVPYSAAVYAAFQISETGRTYALERLSARSLDEALSEALTTVAFSHKQHLLIRAIGDDGVKLSLFTIKRKSQPRWVHRDHVTRAVHDLYADPVCVIDGEVLK